MPHAVRTRTRNIWDVRWISLLIATTLFAFQVEAGEAHLIFTPDQSVAHKARNRAREMVQFATVELGLKLDWSDASIEDIEALSGQLHDDLRRARAAYGDVEKLAQLLGSYVGEVFRRNHGGEWGIVDIRSKRVLALRSAHGSAVMWPIERIKQRIRVGATSNVWAYYQARTGTTNSLR
jgi:hypothetical protein